MNPDFFEEEVLKRLRADRALLEEEAQRAAMRAAGLPRGGVRELGVVVPDGVDVLTVLLGGSCSHSSPFPLNFQT